LTVSSYYIVWIFYYKYSKIIKLLQNRKNHREIKQNKYETRFT